jgi:DNA modification methylase
VEKILTGDCRVLLRDLPAESINCVVTSPPYWNLRDYKIEPLLWEDGWRGVHGLEPTIELYVRHSIEIFREIRRVLRSDGTLWLNLGDSYASGGRGGSPLHGIVLDPFAGAGTVALVARNLGRHCVLMEMNPEYVVMAERRLAGLPVAPPITEQAHAVLP